MYLEHPICFYMAAGLNHMKSIGETPEAWCLYNTCIHVYVLMWYCCITALSVYPRAHNNKSV